MRRSNLSGAIDYVPEVTWILFLRILDERETDEAEQAEVMGLDFTSSLEYPYRWQDWASPASKFRQGLFNQGQGKFFEFMDSELLPYLHKLENNPNATPRQRVISEI